MGQSAGDLRAFLAGLFRTAVETAHPSTFLPPLLPPPPAGRIVLLAAGKAAGSMAETAENFYLDRQRLAAEKLSGIAVARHGYGRSL
jgi:hydroxypyruvate reductase